MHVRKLPLLAATFVAFSSLTTAVAGATGAVPPPVLTTDRGCYTVGQPVAITGIGFAPTRTFQLTLDGIDLGTSTTNVLGGFTATIRPGGLGANRVQEIEGLTATDGTSTSKATITVTRKTGGRVIVTGGTTVTTLRAQFQVWGFAFVGGMPPASATTSTKLPVYVHYVSPRKTLRRTVAVGNTGGQCGYLRSTARRLFPFVPSAGSWTLQLDTSRSYSKHPAGVVTRIDVRVT